MRLDRRNIYQEFMNRQQKFLEVGLLFFEHFFNFMVFRFNRLY